MNNDTTLQRFVDAQAKNYHDALHEIKNGKKQTHWMWYVFPQIAGLGLSQMAVFYSIKDTAEAQEYLKHPVLGLRLIEISSEILKLESSNATSVLGSPDDVKLQSSMTLFASLTETNPVFDKVLAKFYGSVKDSKTLKILGE